MPTRERTKQRYKVLSLAERRQVITIMGTGALAKEVATQFGVHEDTIRKIYRAGEWGLMIFKRWKLKQAKKPLISKPLTEPEPTSALPGSPEKKRILAERYANGQYLHSDRDRTFLASPWDYQGFQE